MNKDFLPEDIGKQKAAGLQTALLYPTHILQFRYMQLYELKILYILERILFKKTAKKARERETLWYG